MSVFVVKLRISGQNYPGGQSARDTSDPTAGMTSTSREEEPSYRSGELCTGWYGAHAEELIQRVLPVTQMSSAHSKLLLEIDRSEHLCTSNEALYLWSKLPKELDYQVS